MKKLSFKTVILIILAVSIGVLPLTAQKRRPFCGFSLKDGYYYEKREHQYITREATVGDESGIPDVVEEIKRAIGIDVLIAVYIAKDEENCFATIGKGGKRILIADHMFLDKVNRQSGTDWAAISIIAHEIGHHIAGFSRREKATDAELDADYWSGYALQKLGASKESSTKCILYYGTEHDTDSHPNKQSRAKIIEDGWDDAKAGHYESDRCESCN